MPSAVLLLAHGTVDALDDLPAFLTNIRRGHAPSPELVKEVRHRHEAIGGRSPLNDINRNLARLLEPRLGVPVRLGNRLWRPTPKEVLAELASAGATRVVVLALAQHSSHVYAEAARKAAEELAAETGKEKVQIAPIPDWGSNAALLDLQAALVREGLAKVPEAARAKTALLLSAHSLPKHIVDAGDPYEREVRAAAAGVAERVKDVLPHAFVAFQSQGLAQGPGGRPMPWLGPDLPATLDAIRAAGCTHVLAAPIGFLADHVEILYDIDVEARGWAKERGLELFRAPSPNDSDRMIGVLSALIEPMLRDDGGRVEG
jgi:ferrochelatase